MNTDLRHALSESFRTHATVKSRLAADQCIEQATEYWIEKNKPNPWSIVTVDITLLTHVVTAIGPATITSKTLGLLTPHTFEGFHQQNTLFIYSSDRYTENWVHQLVMSVATPESCRVLNIDRQDKGPILDLGSLKLP